MSGEYPNKQANIVNRGIALVVDDNIVNRKILASYLVRVGFEVLHAENGQVAIESVTRQRPDIIFMDIMMPVMDGYDATIKIKSLEQRKFIPVIFVTSLYDEATLAKCIAVGGDDFLAKPINHTVLLSKIHALERIRDLHRDMSSLYDRVCEDEHIAQHVYSNSVFSRNVAMDAVQALVRPAGTFSGDMFLTAHTPSRDLYVLLGDFTGHGLSAALGALPVSEVFHSMTRKGYSPQVILQELNHKLCTLLPDNMFMAAQFVSVRYDLSEAVICNCGMPDIVVVNPDRPDERLHVASAGFPLGIIESFDVSDAIVTLPVIAGDSVILVSDGLTEACNQSTEPFGDERLARVIVSSVAGDNLLDNIVSALDDFVGDAKQSDDISVVVVPVAPEILPAWADVVNGDERAVEFDREKVIDILATPDSLTTGMTIASRYLPQADPVPFIVGYFTSTVDLSGHDQSMFIILTALYNNAVDIGWPGIDVDGIANDELLQHPATRKEKLLALGHRSISLNVTLAPFEDRMYLRASVSHNAEGNELISITSPEPVSNTKHQHQRGLTFLKGFCDSVELSEDAKTIAVYYSWLVSH